jgi:Flp pilus assembly protein TadG
LPSARWQRCFAASRRSLVRSQRGTALIETALILPLLLLICVGIFEFGRAYQTWEVLTNAAREGARVAILPSTAPGDAETRVRQFLAGGGLNSGPTVGVAVTAATVSMGAAGNSSGSTVTVTYPFSFMVLQPVAQLVVSGTMTGSPITITATTTMRNETGS